MRDNVGLFLGKRALLNPHRVALIEAERDRQFSYAELDGRANRAARLLAALGVSPGDRVALLAKNSVEFVEIYFGVAKLGAILVPLNWRLVASELAFMLRDSGAAVLIHGAEFDALAGALCDCSLDDGGVPDVRQWIRIGRPDAAPAAAPFIDYAAAGAAYPETEPPIGAEGDAELFIMYTSGTTGLPKGAVHTHNSVIAASITMNMTGDYRYDDRVLQLLPLFHVGALAPLTCSVHRGSASVIMESFDREGIFDVIEKYRVTTGFLVPTLLEQMLGSPRIETSDLTSLNWIMCGAAPVPPELITTYARLGVEIHQAYGLTESAGPGCIIAPESAVTKAGSAGHAFFHTDVRVVDDNSRPVAVGAVGELIIRGKHVMKGYWHRDAETRETIRDGWLYTGDLASVDEEGFIYIRDRKKDMIISGGENVYPAEVENVLAGHPDIADVAVIGVPSLRWGESPLAVVVPRPGHQIEPDSVLAFCRDKLARYKQPRLVACVDVIPRTPTGKILKRELRNQFPGPAPE